MGNSWKLLILFRCHALYISKRHHWSRTKISPEYEENLNSVLGGQRGVCHQKLAYRKFNLENAGSELKKFPYKIQLKEKQTPQTETKRVDFANIMSNWIKSEKKILQKILFSEEAHFYLSGYVNRHIKIEYICDQI